MNLVAKEFVATKVNQRGVLILSEMAGATKELGESLLVNPTNIKGVADAIYKALTMNPEDQKNSIEACRRELKDTMSINGLRNLYKHLRKQVKNRP